MVESSGNFDRNRAVFLLQEATRLIAGRSVLSSNRNLASSSQSMGQQAQQSSPNFQQNMPSTSTQQLSPNFQQNMPSTSTRINNVNNDRVLGNFRNLFAPYGTTNSRSTSSTVQSANPPKKRKKQNAALFRRETWTHTFCCLANREQCVPPTVNLKAKLQQAGLGQKKICLNWKANAIYVKTKLEDVFPKLTNSGGFDILRLGPQTSELVLIKPPRSGYSVPFLRDAAGLGQAVAFIRPIQDNLDLTPMVVTESSEVSLHYWWGFGRKYKVGRGEGCVL